MNFNYFKSTITPKNKAKPLPLFPAKHSLNKTGPIRIQALQSSPLRTLNQTSNRLVRVSRPIKTTTSPRTKKFISPTRRIVKSANHRRRSSYTQNAPKLIKRPPHTRNFSVDNLNFPVVAKFSHQTRQGMIPGNPEKQNQDSFFECVNLGPKNDTYLFGVCDGHGFYGRQVSSFVKQRLPMLVSEDPNFSDNVKKTLTDCILQCNQQLKQIQIDTNFSGTTLVVILIREKTLWCANVGDSRALVARQIKDFQNQGRHWMSVALSRDHKPDSSGQEQRILKAGGRVQSYSDQEGNPVGPARVWLRHDDVPGLAMSRSLGDGVAASVGVIAVPEILEFALQPEDKFIVMGSDGVFEFISNQEVVKFVVPYWKVGDLEGAVDRLERESVARWKQNEEVIDDITSLCIFLDIQ